MKPSLDDEVLRTGPQRIDRRFFTDRSRKDDERHVGGVLANERKRFERAESRHRPIREHDVARAPLQGGEKRFAIFCADVRRLVAEPPQRQKGQIEIVVAVLDEDDT